MKKTLALLLALIMMLSVSLVACNNNSNNDGGNDDGIEDDDGFVGLGTTPVTDETDDETGNNLGGWESVSVTVYVLANNLNIRSAADADDSSILGKASIGNSFVATAADDDWYKITYEGKEAYINAAYVTTNQAEAEFVDCTPEAIKIKNTVVDADATKEFDKYAKVNLRTDPVVHETTATTTVLIYSDTTNGELMKVAANKAGTWYKVTYKDNTYYIASGSFKYFEGYTGGSSGGLG